MKKIDLHLHTTLWSIPKLGKIHVSSAEKMIPHLEALGIRKAVLMSGGEKRVPMGKIRPA